MPFVRITLQSGHSSEDIDTISKSIHQSLMEEFNVPIDDYFHVVEVLDKSQIYFPQQYLGIPHTDNIVYIQITAAVGRTDDQKRRLYAQIAHRISSATPIAKSDVITILVETPVINWSLGNGEVQGMVHLHVSEE